MEEAEPEEQDEADTASPVPEEPRAEPDDTRDVKVGEDIAPLSWEDYLECSANSIHGSLTESALRDDEDAPPTREALVAKKTLWKSISCGSSICQKWTKPSTRSASTSSAISTRMATWPQAHGPADELRLDHSR